MGMEVNPLCPLSALVFHFHTFHLFFFMLLNIVILYEYILTLEMKAKNSKREKRKKEHLTPWVVHFLPLLTGFYPISTFSSPPPSLFFFFLFCIPCLTEKRR